MPATVPSGPEAALAERLDAIEHELRAALSPSAFVALDLAAALRWAVFPGGRRWRPLLVLSAAELAGAPWRQAVPAAAAVELVHGCSLVFDDLPCMDDAPLRRGAPSVHARFGEGTAVLAGLGLLTTAYGLLARGPRPARAVALASHYLGPAQLLTGQAVDLVSRGGADAQGVDSHALARVKNRKTSALVKLALLLGALHGRTTRAQRRALAVFGGEIGNAYQRMDDLHDLREDGALDASVATSATRERIEAHLRRGVAALEGAFAPSPARAALAGFADTIRAAVPAATAAARAHGG